MLFAKSKPQFAEGIPPLTYGYGMTAWGPGGRIVRIRDRGFFHVGWHDRHQASDWDRFCIAGFELAVPPETLEMLRDHNLEIEVTEDKDGTSRYLIARKY